MTRLQLVALAFFAVFAATVPAGRGSAHAFLDRAEPAVGSTAQVAPKDVRLWFSEPLEAAFSSIRVVDSAGKTVDGGDAQVDPHIRTLLQVSLPLLSPGTYHVFWRAVSVDTHTTEGDFTFEVKP